MEHNHSSTLNILDWGLDDPRGFRGWGGGNLEPAVVVRSIQLQLEDLKSSKFQIHDC